MKICSERKRINLMMKPSRCSLPEGTNNYKISPSEKLHCPIKPPSSGRNFPSRKSGAQYLAHHDHARRLAVVHPGHWVSNSLLLSAVITSVPNMTNVEGNHNKKQHIRLLSAVISCYQRLSHRCLTWQMSKATTTRNNNNISEVYLYSPMTNRFSFRIMTNIHLSARNPSTWPIMPLMTHNGPSVRTARGRIRRAGRSSGRTNIKPSSRRGRNTREASSLFERLRGIRSPAEREGNGRRCRSEREGSSAYRNTARGLIAGIRRLAGRAAGLAGGKLAFAIFRSLRRKARNRDVCRGAVIFALITIRSIIERNLRFENRINRPIESYSGEFAARLELFAGESPNFRKTQTGTSRGAKSKPTNLRTFPSPESRNSSHQGQQWRQRRATPVLRNVLEKSVCPDGLWDGEENGLTCDTGLWLAARIGLVDCSAGRQAALRSSRLHTLPDAGRSIRLHQLNGRMKKPRYWMSIVLKIIKTSKLKFKIRTFGLTNFFRTPSKRTKEKVEGEGKKIQEAFPTRRGHSFFVSARGRPMCRHRKKEEPSGARVSFARGMMWNLPRSGRLLVKDGACCSCWVGEYTWHGLGQLSGKVVGFNWQRRIPWVSGPSVEKAEVKVVRPVPRVKKKDKDSRREDKKPKPRPISPLSEPISPPAETVHSPAEPVPSPAERVPLTAEPNSSPADSPLVEPGSPPAESDLRLAEPDSPPEEPSSPLEELDSPLAEPSSPLAEPNSPLPEPDSPLPPADSPLAKPDSPLAEPDSPPAKPDSSPPVENGVDADVKLDDSATVAEPRAPRVDESEVKIQSESVRDVCEKDDVSSPIVSEETSTTKKPDDETLDEANKCAARSGSPPAIDDDDGPLPPTSPFRKRQFVGILCEGTRLLTILTSPNVRPSIPNIPVREIRKYVQTRWMEDSVGGGLLRDDRSDSGVSSLKSAGSGDERSGSRSSALSTTPPPTHRKISERRPTIFTIVMRFSKKIYFFQIWREGGMSQPPAGYPGAPPGLLIPPPPLYPPLAPELWPTKRYPTIPTSSPHLGHPSSEELERAFHDQERRARICFNFSGNPKQRYLRIHLGKTNPVIPITHFCRKIELITVPCRMTRYCQLECYDSSCRQFLRQFKVRTCPSTVEGEKNPNNPRRSKTVCKFRIRSRARRRVFIYSVQHDLSDKNALFPDSRRLRLRRQTRRRNSRAEQVLTKIFIRNIDGLAFFREVQHCHNCTTLPLLLLKFQACSAGILCFYAGQIIDELTPGAPDVAFQPVCLIVFLSGYNIEFHRETCLEEQSYVMERCSLQRTYEGHSKPIPKVQVRSCTKDGHSNTTRDYANSRGLPSRDETVLRLEKRSEFDMRRKSELQIMPKRKLADVRGSIAVKRFEGVYDSRGRRLLPTKVVKFVKIVFPARPSRDSSRRSRWFCIDEKNSLPSKYRCSNPLVDLPVKTRLIQTHPGRLGLLNGNPRPGTGLCSHGIQSQ
ncbi:unnamed protein product, partial [Nesidiocoris tenuis]